MRLPLQLEWLRDAVDILLVSLIFYRLLILVRGTRAAQMFIGLITLVLLGFASELLHLAVLGWIVGSLRTVWVIVFVIIFQPELRRALSQISESRLFKRFVPVEEFGYLGEIQNAVERLSRKGLGALVVIERNIGLRNYLETGTKIEALVTAELIETIFTPPSPLHDGAVIIRGGVLMGAGCILPLSSNPNLERTLGTRHRAALGLSEETDAIVLVVSEETRQISVAEGGQMTRGLQLGDLKSRLSALLRVQAKRPKAAETAG